MFAANRTLGEPCAPAGPKWVRTVTVISSWLAAVWLRRTLKKPGMSTAGGSCAPGRACRIETATRVALEKRIAVLETELREARALVDLDPLTSLYNRRFFHAALEREVARASRYERKLALMILDLDDFKAANDSLGHLAGDSLLSDLAVLLRAAVRGGDVAARIGGDEFAVLLPESTVEDAEVVFARLQRDLGTRGELPAISVSAGIAGLAEGDDALSLFERADQAMYRAKNYGQHRLALDEATLPPVWP